MFDYKDYKSAAFTVCVDTKCKRRNKCRVYANKKDLGVSIKIYNCDKRDLKG